MVSDAGGAFLLRRVGGLAALTVRLLRRAIDVVDTGLPALVDVVCEYR